MYREYFFDTNSISQELWDEFVQNVWFCRKSIQDVSSENKGKIKIRLDDEVQEDTLHDELQKMFNDVVIKNRVPTKILYSLKQKKNEFYHGDIMRELEDKGDLYEYDTGRYAYSGIVKELMNYFDDKFVNSFADDDLIDYEFPVSISWDVIKRTNYPTEFPHNLTFLTAFPRDNDCYQNYIKNPILNTKDTDSIGLLFSPTVCFHLYELLRDKTLTNSFCGSAKGKCYRNEYISKPSLERLREFNMRELIFIGDKQFVISSRERIMKKTIEFAEKVGLHGKVQVAHDPFFVSNYAERVFFQEKFELKYELRADINDEGKSIAIASFNVHNDHFSRAFNIRLANSDTVWTGCCAYGIERWAFAYLKQYGLDRCRWRLD